MTDQGKQTTQAQAARRIAALLAMAEDAAKQGDEKLRDTYLEKASALQLQYVIDEAALSAAQGAAHKKEEIVFDDFCQESNTPLIKAKRELIASLAQNFRGRTVMLGEWKKDASGNPVYDRNGKLAYNKRAKIRVWAHESDLAFIRMMYSSLTLQMQSMMAKDEAELVDGLDRKAQNGWRVSYAHAWVNRVHNRMLADKRRQEGEAIKTPGTGLVLRDRSDAVDARINQEYTKLRSSRVPTGANANAAGRAAGRAAGDRADLNRSKVSNADRSRIGS